MLAKMKQSWLEKGLPLKEQDSSILRLKEMLKGTFKKKEVQMKNSSTNTCGKSGG